MVTAKRVLVLAHYYAPDLSACSFRAKPLVEAMATLGGDGVEVDVVTTQPSRYGSYGVRAQAEERSGNVTVHRVRLPELGEGKLGQVVGFLVYSFGVLRFVMGRRYALVFATSGRLMTAVLGALVSRLKGVPVYLDVRDLFVDTMKHILAPWSGRVMLPVFAILERWAFSRATRINLVSRGFEPYMRARYPGKELSWFTNGIDAGFEVARNGSVRASQGPVEVLYAGNIGDGQGLHLIIPAIARLADGEFRFTVIGDGGKRAALEDAVAAAGVGQLVQVVGPRARQEIASAYAGADILFVHLNDFEAFAKVLPSKIFEYAATGKSICAGVAGFAAEFIRAEVQDAEVFPPCDAAAGLAAMRRLKLGLTDRSGFVARYSRDSISRRMAAEILGTIGIGAGN